MGSGVHVADCYLSPEFDPNDCGALDLVSLMFSDFFGNGESNGER